jgi:outer membrane protein OmpA-like peptidoglycan-associated protein
MASALALALVLTVQCLHAQASSPPPASLAPAALPAAAGGTAAPERFAFAYEAGDKFRVLSEVNEEVYVNHRFLSKSSISNRIAFEVVKAGTDGPGGSWGLLRGTFLTEEKPEGSSLPLVTESYDSEFKRDALGQYDIDPQYYMPVVRNCPVFPDHPVVPGETWTAPGEERHDLRRAFGIPDPYAIPFVAHYRYEGKDTKDGKTYDLITASYTIFTQPGPPRAYKDVYPVEIAGYSDQKIWWDPALAQTASYEERFKLVFDWSDGSTIEYRGTAGASIIEATRMDKAAVQADVQKAVSDMPNVTVKQDDLGVTISIENIQFLADSADLRAEEAKKVAAIAAILARYPDRDILIAGHTALAGSPEGRQKLSEQRAAAVAKALLAAGAGPASRLHAVGYGADKPVADNGSADGMARNRRVEITILEN